MNDFFSDLFRSDPDVPDPRIFWIMDEDGTVRNPKSYEEVEEFRESGRASLEKTWLVGEDGEPIFVATVFLIHDHGMGWSLEESGYMPILWETMVFKGDDPDFSEWSRRYKSSEEALIGHAEMVEEMKKLGVKKP